MSVGRADQQGGITRDEWLTVGRVTLEGWLTVVRGGRKVRTTSIFDHLYIAALEDAGVVFPRYQDLHAVFANENEGADDAHRFDWPLVRYRKPQPIPGLDSACDGHRVRVECTVSDLFDNGLGAHITRARGVCLDCEAS